MPTQITSDEAFKKLTRKAERRAVVLKAYMQFGEMTDHEMVIFTGLPLNSICGIRNTLVAMGVVEDTKKRKVGPFGVNNIIWDMKKNPEPQPF